MGNSTSSSSSYRANKMDNIIDYIATHYILTTEFKNLTKLSDKDYCEKLIILTSSILDRYLTKSEVKYLEQRTKNGVEINEFSTDDIVFLEKDQLDRLDVKNDEKKTLKKKRMCIGIAKFYVKIAHIFAAIVMTINPIYSYTDEYGNKIKTDLYNKPNIPPGSVKRVSNINICSLRINALQTGMNSVNPENNEINVSPKVCDINLNKDKTLKSLKDEPGIPQLRELYNDIYDYSTGKFIGMSENSKMEFNNNLRLFYEVFTGNKDMPDDIKDFSDIKLKDYAKTHGCQNNSLKNSYTGSSSDNLFKTYAENIKTMVENANLKQNKLLNIINILFMYVVDPHTKQKKIRINPQLTERLLSETVDETIRLITDLYVTCERDYITGIKLYEAIINTIGFKTLNNQKVDLENKMTQLINMENTSPPPRPNYLNSYHNLIKPPENNYLNTQQILIKPPITNFLNSPLSKPLVFNNPQTPINLNELNEKNRLNKLNTQLLLNDRRRLNDIHYLYEDVNPQLKM